MTVRVVYLRNSPTAAKSMFCKQILAQLRPEVLNKYYEIRWFEQNEPMPEGIRPPSMLVVNTQTNQRELIGADECCKMLQTQVAYLLRMDEAKQHPQQHQQHQQHQQQMQRPPQIQQINIKDARPVQHTAATAVASGAMSTAAVEQVMPYMRGGMRGVLVGVGRGIDKDGNHLEGLVPLVTTSMGEVATSKPTSTSMADAAAAYNAASKAVFSQPTTAQ